MSRLTSQEYLELCEKLAAQYYDQDYEIEGIPEESWIPAESEAKEKLKKMLNHNGFVDLTNASRSQVTNRFHTSNNFKVGNFLVKVTKFSEMPLEGIRVDLIIYEEKLVRNKFFKNTNISVKVDPIKDMRFGSKDWASYFKKDKKGINIPIEIIPDIIRWLQAVQKMKAFL